MHGSKLPLTVWFWSAYLMATHSNGIAALQLQKQLGLGSYKSAWLLCAKLRRAIRATAPAASSKSITTVIPHHTKADTRPAGKAQRRSQYVDRWRVEVYHDSPVLCGWRLSPTAAAILHAFIKANDHPVVPPDGDTSYSGVRVLTLS